VHQETKGFTAASGTQTGRIPLGIGEIKVQSFSLLAARLRQARWAAGLHGMRRCGSDAFDVRYTLNSGAKSNAAGCPSWVWAVCDKEAKA
jgi:hypothetical protein